MQLSKVSRANIDKLAHFLEEMNNKKRSHIGFCGEKREEIHDTLLNDFSDLELEDSFIVASVNAKIIGAIGLDIDLKQGYADVWGPYVENEDIEVAQKMWDKISSEMANRIKTFSFFINEGNHFAKAFIAKNQGKSQGDDLVLELTRKKYVSQMNSGIEVYKKNFKLSFQNLHEEVFPKTYFDGDTILNRLSETNTLLLVRKNENEIKGYVYIEANPKHEESNIEYIAVAKEHRKGGVGKSLLIGAVHTIFSYPEIDDITICVSGENHAAINLYKSAGFSVKYVLNSYDVLHNNEN